jgi:PPK2 family polyphosphate:nucleotide phosphotransferase
VKHPHRFDHDRYRLAPGRRVLLAGCPTGADGSLDKAKAKEVLEGDVAALRDAQRLLWASQHCAVLVVLQGMDTAGKDGTIRHVMTGINPQGCAVHAFKAPSEEELEHHFLWRPTRYLPGRGRIAIFNRSYYEEVLVVRVHPELLERQRLPPELRGDELWRARYADINTFEQALADNGTSVLKFFLHISREEQKKRLLKRLDHPAKSWKFSAGDRRERALWDDYVEAYESMLGATSTDRAPWYVVPADDKWFARALVADVITTRIGELDLSYPEVPESERAELDAARAELEAE